MVDITFKSNSLRKAIATAIVEVGSTETIEKIKNRKVPKGDVFEMSKTAGLLAVKKTSDVIPDCHPLPVEFTKITHQIEGLYIVISVEVHTIYKTGVEVEAMYGASVVAMTIYDMLKPIDKNIIVKSISLQEKKGGKSDFRKDSGEGKSAAVIIISDSIASGKKEDKGGQIIKEILEKNKITISTYQIIKDNADEIKTCLKVNSQSDLIILSGGTGLTKNDITTQTVEPMLETNIPGIMEYARSYGQERTPYSMLSRSFAGTMGKSLILGIPGSSGGAKETMEALFPYVLHVFKMLESK